MSTQTIAAAKCQEIYREAQIFFSQIPYWRNYGFKILNGPPLFQPPILFIGYQPGGGSDDFELETALGSDKHWPATCEYATASWIGQKNAPHVRATISCTMCRNERNFFAITKSTRLQT